MLLAIDIGNSLTSLGLFQGSELLHQWTLSTNRTRTVDELEGLLSALLTRHQLQFSSIRHVSLCSVVPAASQTYEKLAQQIIQCSFSRVAIQPKMPFRVEVDHPAEVGADRLANAAYAAFKLSLPAVVIDIGTAITFDLIVKGPTYVGGIILPGLGLALESLGGRTAQLPIVDIQQPKSVVGRNTVECIQSGVYFGYADALQGLIRRFKEATPGIQDVVLTGGGAAIYEGKLAGVTQYLPNLTLHGIRLFHSLH